VIFLAMAYHRSGDAATARATLAKLPPDVDDGPTWAYWDIRGLRLLRREAIRLCLDESFPDHPFAPWSSGQQVTRLQLDFAACHVPSGSGRDPAGPRIGFAQKSKEEQGHALQLVSAATMHLMSVALCVTRAPVYDAAGSALTVRRAAPRAEDRS
jgi:hypothetical protein